MTVDIRHNEDHFVMYFRLFGLYLVLVILTNQKVKITYKQYNFPHNVVMKICIVCRKKNFWNFLY